MAFNVGAIRATLGFDIPGADRREVELYERKLDEIQRRTAKRDAFKARLGANYDGRAFNAMERDLRRNEKATDDNVRSQGRLRTAFGQVSGAGLGMFAAAGGGYAVFQGLKSIVTASGEAETAQRSLEAQLKAVGTSYAAHGKQVDAVIQKHSLLAGVDDEDLSKAFVSVARATDDVDKAMKSMGLVTDIARARHMDVAKAGDLVGKVMAGNTGILARYGIVLKDNATTEEAVAALRQKFAGQAEAFGKTQTGALERLGVAWENLQETLGEKLAPTLTKVANAGAKFVTEMTEGTGQGGKFVDTLKDMAKTGKDVVGFLKDHINLIKLAAGAWVGYKVAALAGAAASKVAAIGAAGTAAAGAAGGGKGSFAKGIGRSLPLVATGIVVADQIGKNKGFEDAITIKGAREHIDKLVASSKTLEEAQRKVRAFGDDFRKIASMPGKPTGWRDFYNSIAEEADKAGEKMAASIEGSVGQMRRSFNTLRKHTTADMDDINKVVRQNMARIERHLGKNSEDGRKAVSENFRSAIDAVKWQMQRGEVSTREGMRAIRGFLTRELQVYGLSLRQARAEAGGNRLDMGPQEGSAGPRRRQQGGWLGQKGAVGPDTIPLEGGYWAAPGEYYAKGPGGHGAVINRHQAPIVNLALMRGGHTLDTLPRDQSALPRIEAALRDFGGLDAVFSAIQRPHMLQRGGIVELLHPGNDPAHKDHLHIAMNSVRAIVALGKRLQSMGWLVGEHPAFGGVGGHAPGSYHYSGRAIDVNWPDPSVEAAKIRALLPMLGGGALAPARPVPRQRVVGGGAVGRAAQGALDLARAGAQRVLDRAGAVSFAPASGGGGGANRALGRRLMAMFGWGADQWPALNALWTGESNWDEDAINPSSGAGGIPQALPASKMGPGWQGNARQQILWGLGYIKERYGSPASAYSFWQRQSPHWYQGGGRIRASGPSSRKRKRPKSKARPGLVASQRVRNLIGFAELFEDNVQLASLTPSTSDDLYWLRALESTYTEIVNTAPRATAADYVSSLLSTREEIAELMAPPTPPDPVTEVVRPPSPEEIAQGVAAQIAMFNTARSSLFSAYGSNFTLAGQPLVPNTGAGLRHFGAGTSGQKIINQTNIFPTPPPEPHLFARSTLFDLQAAP